MRRFGAEVVEADGLDGGAGDLALLDGRRRDVPRDAGLVGRVDDLLDLQALGALDRTVCRMKPVRVLLLVPDQPLQSGEPATS